MKPRIALAAFLIVIAVVLPLLGTTKRGAPWSYRGHQAVLLESTGNVEITPSEVRRTREGKDDALLKPAPGLFLDTGDEVRVGRYSETRLKLPLGDVVIGDGGRVIFGDKGITLARGLVEVRVPSGGIPFEVKGDGIDATITLRAGGAEGGVFRLLADGKSEVRVLAKTGSAEGTSPAGTEIAESGRVVVIASKQKPRVEPAATALAIANAQCVQKKLTADVPSGAQVFLTGNLLYPEDGKLVFDMPAAGAVALFARDLAGNIARASATCVDKAEKPDKAPKPKQP